MKSIQMKQPGKVNKYLKNTAHVAGIVGQAMLRHPVKTTAVLFGAYFMTNAPDVLAQKSTPLTPVDSAKTTKVLDIGVAYGKTTIKTAKEEQFNALRVDLKATLDSKNSIDGSAYGLFGGPTFAPKDSLTLMGGAEINYEYKFINTVDNDLKARAKGYWNNNADIKNNGKAADAYGLGVSVTGHRPFLTPWTQGGINVEYIAEVRKNMPGTYSQFALTPSLQAKIGKIGKVDSLGKVGILDSARISVGQEIMIWQNGVTYGTFGVYMPVDERAKPYTMTVVDAQIAGCGLFNVDINAKFGNNLQKYGVYLTTVVKNQPSKVGFESLKVTTFDGLQSINGWFVTYSGPLPF